MLKKTLLTSPFLKTLIADGVTSLVTPRARGTVYNFSSDNPDSLEVEPSFTGNIKIIVSSASESGINPQISKGRKNDYTSTTDSVNSPQWVKYEAEVTDLTYIVSSSFDGVVGAYAFDDVWVTIDEDYGDLTRYYFKPDRIDDYISLGSISLSAGDEISFSISSASSITAIVNKGRILSGSGGFYLQLRNDKNVEYTTVISELYIDGVLRNRGKWSETADGKNHVYRLVVASDFNLMNAHGSSTGFNMNNTIMWDLSIKRVNGENLFFPMDDGYTSDGMIRETLLGQHATVMNAQRTGWNNEKRI